MMLASEIMSLLKMFCVFLKMDFFIFLYLCVPHFSAILHGRKLRKVLNGRENCALQPNRAAFFIFGIVF